MDRRVWMALALVATVTLAGCSWVAEEDQPTATPDNSTDNMIPVFRITDHTNALANTSYELDIALRATQAAQGANRTITVRSDRQSQRLLLHNSIANRSLTRYVNGTSVYSRVTRNGATNYTVQSLSNSPLNFSQMHEGAIQRDRLHAVYRVGSFEEVGNTTEDGRRYTEFELADPSTSSNVSLNRSAGEVRIRDDDVITRAFVDLDGTRGGSQLRYTIDYRTVRTENVTVSPPDWLDEAEAASGHNGTDVSGEGNETTTGTPSN